MNQGDLQLQLQEQLAIALSLLPPELLEPPGDYDEASDGAESMDEDDALLAVPPQLLAQAGQPAATSAVAQQQATPVVPVGDAPEWVQRALAWWEQQPGVGRSAAGETVTLPEAQLKPLAALIAAALGQPISAPPGTPVEPRSLVLQTAASAGGGRSVAAAQLDSIISQWLSRCGRQPAMVCLAAAQARLDAASTDAALADAAALLRSRLLARALRLLAEDEDDLFFASGRACSELVSGVKSGHIGAGFLAALAQQAGSREEAAPFERLLRSVMSDVGSASLAAGADGLRAPLGALSVFVSAQPLQRCLVALLLQDVARAAAGGAPFEATSPAAPLFAATTLVSPAPSALMAARSGAGKLPSPAADLFSSLRHYPRCPGDAESCRRMLRSGLAYLHEAQHEVLLRLIKLKDADGAPLGRAAVQAWLAAAAGANAVRLEGGELKALNPRAVQLGSSDGFMLNLLAAALRLCRPFVSGHLQGNAKFADLMTKHLAPLAYQAARRGAGLLEAGGEAAGRLAGVMQAFAPDSLPAGAATGSSMPSTPRTPAEAASPADPAAAKTPATPATPASGSPVSFIADCFFLTQSLLHVALIPAVHRFSCKHTLLRPPRLEGQPGDGSDEELEAGSSGGGGKGGAAAANALRCAYLLSDCDLTQLLDPDMAEDAVQFVTLEALWLLHLLRSGRAADLAAVPQHVVSDMACWLQFVVSCGSAGLLPCVPMGALMDGLVALLDAPQLVRSPLVQEKLVGLMRAMLAPQLRVSEEEARGSSRSLAAAAHVSTGERALVAAVLGTTAAQERLVPALLRVYAGADHVVGLDVDRHAYDKFSFRHAVDVVLEELMRDERCAASMVALAAAPAGVDSPGSTGSGSGGGGLFVSYASALLNDLIYLLNDVLGRLADIQQVEAGQAQAAKARGAKAAQQPTTAEAGERDKKAQFVASQAHTAKGYLRMAKATLRMLGRLTGHPAVAPTFLQQPLLGRAAYACLHFMELLVRGPNGRKVAVADPQAYGYDAPALLGDVVRLAVGLGRSGTGAFQRALREEPDFSDSLLAEAQQLLAQAHRAELEEGLAGLRAALGAAAAAADDGSGSGNSSCSPEKKRQRLSQDDGPSASLLVLPAFSQEAPVDLEAAYCSALGPLATGTFDSCAPRAYLSSYTAMAEEAGGNGLQQAATMMRRLGREMRELGPGGKTALPVGPAAAIFVRHDNDRLDKVRALITGPEGTPYEAGCFLFDLFFPPAYPNVPPLMQLDTTGGGRVRFNPNLYADGKVCLSLLGTWHGGSEAEKWQPGKSGLFQVLLSVQGMVLVADPYFNEPAVELMRGTPEGEAASSAYNAARRLETLRWAMVDLLEAPRPGFEQVIAAHFGALRHRIMGKAPAWVAEARTADSSGALAERMERELQKLHGLLEKL